MLEMLFFSVNNYSFALDVTHISNIRQLRTLELLNEKKTQRPCHITGAKKEVHDFAAFIGEKSNFDHSIDDNIDKKFTIIELKDGICFTVEQLFGVKKIDSTYIYDLPKQFNKQCHMYFPCVLKEKDELILIFKPVNSA